MGSSRFPRKMLARLGPYTLIEWVFIRVNKTKNIDKVLLATSDLPRDDELVKIANKYNRYIPIIDKRAWDILKKKIQSLKEPYKNRVHGEKLTNYCFWFDSVNKNKFSSVLRKAYANTGIEYKSPHCLRHSKSTYLASLDFTEQLSKMILGHTSKTTQRYIHLKDMMEKTEKVGEFSFDDFE